ncbi:MAG TPA: hypothetical protein VIT91_21195 [Chthoniobacterales bacterium]
MIVTPEKDATVEEIFRKAGSRWQWLLFLRLTSWIVLATTLSILCLGLAIWRGWVLTVWIAVVLAALIGVGFGLGMLIAVMVSTARQKPKPWLAERIEERIPSLMDRLNTLAFLEVKTEKTFIHEIRKQAALELTKNPDVRPIPVKPTVMAALAAIVACIGTLLFYQKVHPLAAMWKTDVMPGTKLENTVEMELPEDSSESTRDPWGEVRITEPGGDLKLTKVDVLPLTIEAASSQALQHASFSTAINGAKPTDHPLDAPKEPNYAVYEPTIYLDELGLAAWDVLSYYASAATDEPRKYASEIYFVEVRPFREDVLKLEQKAGAGNGKMGQCLNKLNQLIQKQQDVLRQTHRQTQKPASNNQQQAEDQDKLAKAQSDLELAAGHLYAEVAGLEHMPVATVLEQLALAQGSMTEAVAKLRLPDNPAAETHEQNALQQLVESRKDFVRQLANGGDGSPSSGDKVPTAEEQQATLKSQLADIEDFRDDAKAAQSAVRMAREKQEKIANRVPGAGPKRRTELANQQTEATKSLEEFRNRVPKPFAGLEQQTQAAIDAMENTQKALTDSNVKKTQAATAQAAVDALNKLEQALASKMAQRSLEDVYRFKSIMDSQVEASKNGDAKAAAQAKAAKDAMAGTLKNTPAGKAFGPTLSEALSGAPGERLDEAVAQMGEKPGAGGQAAAAIEEISKAFDAAQPPMLRGIASTGQQGSAPGEGISEATRQLNSLAQRLKDGRAMDAEDIRKQLENARFALLDEAKLPDKDAPALVAVAEDLKALSKEVDLKVNEAALRKLMDRLEDYRLEMAGHEELEKNSPELRHVDPDKAPAEFRERVRRYFEKLSNG